MVKNLPAGDTGDLGWIPGLKKIPWKRKREPTPVFLPGKFHGQRSLVGCSPWACKELHMTEYIHAHTHTRTHMHTHTCSVCVYIYIQKMHC